MSQKESRVGGDPTESTGNPVREQDDQVSEGMSTYLNSEARRGVGVQSTPDSQAPVSGQEQSHTKGGVLSRTRKQTMTTSLTAGHRRMAQKLKKAKAQKSRGVSGSGGTKPGLVLGAGHRRGPVRPLLKATLKPESVQLPDDMSESSDTDEESDGGKPPSSHSPKREQI